MKLVLVILTYFLLLSSSFSNNDHLLKGKSGYQTEHQLHLTDTGITVPEKYEGILNDNQYESIKKGEKVLLNRSGTTVINWNESHTELNYDKKFEQEAYLQNGKVEIEEKVTLSEDSFPIWSLNLMIAFFFSVICSSKILIKAKKIREFFLIISLILSIIIFAWTFMIIPIVLPVTGGQVFNLTFSSLVFSAFAFVSTVNLLKNQDSKYGRILGSSAMLVAGICLVLI